ncbi:hypothetical protein QUA46_25895 [Microcoleus sp. MON2_D6]|uniref:hypothetical protein n=2 Tax=unclassified Microcoleus TaxID=2642155 RepID=UPI002FD4C0A0
MNYSKRARRLGLGCGSIFNQLFMGGVAETAHKKYFLWWNRPESLLLTLLKSLPKIAFDPLASRIKAPGFIRPEIKNLYPMKLAPRIDPWGQC